MIPLLFKFAGVDFKRISIIALVVAAGLLYAYIHGLNVQLEQAQLVYQNPRVVTKIVKRREVGPVRIITRVVERPSGERETTIEESRGPVIETENEATETTPVPLSIALAPLRTDRYLLSAGFNRLSADFDGKALFVGYGFKNRLDVQVGGIKKDGLSPWVLTTFRF